MEGRGRLEVNGSKINRIKQDMAMVHRLIGLSRIRKGLLWGARDKNEDISKSFE